MNPHLSHPNKIPFSAVLCHLDEASDMAPGGSRGHRIILPSNVAEAALESLHDMGVNFATEFDGHDVRQKFGIIKHASIERDSVGKFLRVEGFLYLLDFPEVNAQLRKPGAEFGMSYELCNAGVKDMRENVWTLTRVTFTGAAVLQRTKAAYRKSSFTIIAAAEVFDGRLTLISKGRIVTKAPRGARTLTRSSPAPRRPRG